MERPVHNVLIADGNAERGQQIADAIEQGGLRCRRARHGVEALEIALSESPTIVIAALGLPLVDAPRLAEILRANPRTRAVRFLYLGDEEHLGAAAGVGDILLPATLRPNDLIPNLGEMLRSRERIDDLEAAARHGGAGEGDLQQIGLADLLQLLHVSGKTGSVEVTRGGEEGRDEEVGAVHVRDGEIVHASAGTAEGEKALFRMLTWDEGRFVLRPTSAPQVGRILVPTRALLAEGLRQVGEWRRLASRLPARDAQIKLRVAKGALPNVVHPLTQEVLLLLELYRRVGDVVDQCSFPDYQVLRTLGTLAERGIVELGRARLGALPQQSDGLFDEAQRRRLREWVRESSEGAPAAAPKIVVAASDPSALPDFANLLHGVEDVTLSSAMARAELTPRDLAAMGHVRVDDELSLELLHVPSGAAFAPLWPTAGHAALGVVFLLSGAVGEAAERLAPMVEAVRALPRSRVFLVALVAKGERLSPDELRENLQLIDEASLFLLPLEAVEDATPRLARLFGRLVP